VSFIAISTIILILSSLGLGLFVYKQSPKSALNYWWLFLSILVAVWASALFGVMHSHSASTALQWQYVLDIVAILIPVFYINFISVFIKKKIAFKKYIIAASFLLIILSLTSFFKNGVTTQFGFYWIDPGVLYVLFPIFFITIVLYSFFILTREYRLEKNKNRRRKIAYHIFAGFIGFSGGVTNFLPQLFGVFPFGSYFIVLYVFLISYSILKHQQFNIKQSTTQLISGFVVFLFLFRFLQPAVSTKEWFINLALFLVVVVGAIVLIKTNLRAVKKQQQIEKLVKDLVDVNKQLRDLETRKFEFTSIASHQLRTPLTIIKGHASMLAEGSFGFLPKDIKNITKKILNKAETLIVSVENILTVSRIERGKIQYTFEEVSIKKIIESVIKKKQAIFEEKRLNFTFKKEDNSDFMVLGNYKKLKQVISGVFDNAIYYTQKGLVRAELTRDKKNKIIRLSISDTGVGMKKEQAQSLFKEYKNKNSVESAVLTGLGVYIAGQTIRAHNGCIWAVSSGVGSGTTVFIELPEYKYIKK